jgi:hypothetical protein
MKLLQRARHLLQGTLMMIVLALTLCACSTTRTVTVEKTIVLRPPSEYLVTCIPERVKEDTVRALAHAYVTNTTEVWTCNNRIQSYKEWLERQEKIYGDGNSHSK